MHAPRGGCEERPSRLSDFTLGGVFRCTHPEVAEERRSRRSDFNVEEGVSAASIDAQEADVDDEAVSREFKREEHDMKLKEKQRKVSAAREAYEAEEKLLYEQLSGLCRDAAWTKSYVAAALLMTKELFQESVFNLGDTMQPLPAVKSIVTHRAEAPAGEVEGSEASSVAGFEVPPAVTGQLGSNMLYNASMPEFATRTRARATLDELRATAQRNLRAHKATAQPLELHASPEARGGQPVPPARRGATALPLYAVPAAALAPRTQPTALGAGAGAAGTAAGGTPTGTLGARTAFSPAPITPGRSTGVHA